MAYTHFTLAPRFNAILIVVLAGVAGVLLWVVRPHPVLLTAVGAAAGILTGILQRASVRSAAATFAGAQSAVEVRRAFMSNWPGRVSIAMVWIAAAVLAAIALSEGGGVPGFAAGYVSFMLVREILGVRAVSQVMGNAPDS